MSDVFAKFAPRVRPAEAGAERHAEEPLATPGKPAYQAVMTDPTNRRSPARLKVVYGDGAVSLFSYAFLVELLCTSPQFLSLVFTHCVVTCEGERLDGMIDAIQEEKARTLHCFHPARFGEPAADTPLIRRIKRQTRAALARVEDDGQA